MWFATLSGAEEVPPVTTTATGSATLVLDAAETTLTYTITQSVSGATAAHFHAGFPGESGAVAVPVTNISPTMAGQVTLNASQVTDLKAGKLYLNFHSPSHAAGEIRGQVLPQGAQLFVAPLNGDEEVPRVSSTNTGFASVILSADRTSLTYHLTTTATPTASHLHRAIAGVSGAVAVPLTLTGSTANGSAVVTADLASDLERGRVYANVHTAARAGGELRGQLRKPGEQVFVATMTGTQEVPVVTTTNTGSVQVLLAFAGDSIRYEGTTTATVTASHLHAAHGGVSGAVAVAFATSLSGTAALSATQATALTTGLLYANVHTAAHAGGELRGQVLRPGEKLLTAVMSGANEVPANASTATGGAQVVLNPAGDHIVCAGSFSGLTATASHLHAGAVGANGGVKVALTVAGSALSCDAAITTQDATDLLVGGWYANVHTTANPGGEIRGQLTVP